eukprot:2165212-Pyramimonas_sp.AAC.1
MEPRAVVSDRSFSVRPAPNPCVGRCVLERSCALNPRVTFGTAWIASKDLPIGYRILRPTAHGLTHMREHAGFLRPSPCLSHVHSTDIPAFFVGAPLHAHSFDSEVTGEDISGAIDEAKETCEDGTAGECAAAWDTVEELSATAAHQKAKAPAFDPME